MAMGPAGLLPVAGVQGPPHGDLPVEILESKLYKPTIRPGVVSRPRLLARLSAARTLPIVAVVAPAGYGKTTLLALWAEADDRAFVAERVSRFTALIEELHLQRAEERIG